MSLLPNLAGGRFGKLTVLASAGSLRGRRLWFCKCSCGITTKVATYNLTCGRTTSCGCVQRQNRQSGDISRTHGLSKTPEYQALANAVQRCKPHSPHRADYFERGIAVCDKWRSLSKKGVEDFIAHIGLRHSPKHTLDRIDNDGNYERGNVQWATMKEQIKNQRPRLRIDQFSDSVLLVECKKRQLI